VAADLTRKREVLEEARFADVLSKLVPTDRRLSLGRVVERRASANRLLTAQNDIDRAHQHGGQNRMSLAAHEGDQRDGPDGGHPAE
jgi:hypothetical protein